MRPVHRPPLVVTLPARDTRSVRGRRDSHPPTTKSRMLFTICPELGGIRMLLSADAVKQFFPDISADEARRGLGPYATQGSARRPPGRLTRLPHWMPPLKASAVSHRGCGDPPARREGNLPSRGGDITISAGETPASPEPHTPRTTAFVVPRGRRSATDLATFRSFRPLVVPVLSRRSPLVGFRHCVRNVGRPRLAPVGALGGRPLIDGVWDVDLRSPRTDARGWDLGRGHDPCDRWMRNTASRRML